MFETFYKLQSSTSLTLLLTYVPSVVQISSATVHRHTDNVTVKTKQVVSEQRVRNDEEPVRTDVHY